MFCRVLNSLLVLNQDIIQQNKCIGSIQNKALSSYFVNTAVDLFRATQISVRGN